MRRQARVDVSGLLPIVASGNGDEEGGWSQSFELRSLPLQVVIIRKPQ